MTSVRTVGSRHLGAAVLATLLLVSLFAAPTRAQSADDIARTASNGTFAPEGSNVVPTPAPGETVRVLVGVDTPARSAGESAPTARNLERRAIASAQDGVASALAGTESTVVAEFENVAGLAAEVTAEGLAELRASPDVAGISIDGVAEPLVDVSTALVNADDAWTTADGSGQSIAIIDTGVQADHDFLNGKVVHQACFADDTAPGSGTGDCPNGQNSQIGGNAAEPCSFGTPGLDGCDHGTHIASIAAGSDATFDGVARGADIVALQVFHNDGGGALAYFSDIIEALEEAYQVRDSTNLAAVNMSLGGLLFSSFCDTFDESPGNPTNDLMFDAVQNLKDEGVATVVASGNDGVIDAVGFPACLSNVISVGNVFSGKSGSPTDAVVATSNAAAFLRILGPGTPIEAAGVDNTVPRNDTITQSGTSMAAPHVAGAIAVLRDAGSDADVDEQSRVDHLHGLLRASGTCVNDPGIPGNSNDDFARLDVQAAIDWTEEPSALFWDIECGRWFESAANWLGFDPDGVGPVQPLAAGFADGTFRGDASITRAQDARQLYRLFGEPSPAPFEHSFGDVLPWVDEAVDWVNWPQGPADPDALMTGYGSDFRPNENISRAAKARQLYRAAGSPTPGSVDLPCDSHGFTDVPIWVEDAVIWITCPDVGVGGTTPIATGYANNTFRPGNDITRAQAARMLERFNDAGHVPA